VRAIIFKAVSLPIALATAGMLLVFMGIMTPVHSNEAAYQSAVAGLTARAMNASADATQPLSDAFFAAGDTYGTVKWPVLDTGYSLLAWAVFMAILQAATRGRSLSAILPPSRRWTWLLGLSLLGLIVLAVAVYDSRMRLLGRGQLPWWADSVIISMAELWFLLILASPFVVALAVGPVLSRRAAPASILVLSGDSMGRNAVGGLVYALPVLFSAYLATQVFQPGGWATSTGGVVLLWLFLNGRALLVGPPPLSSVEPAMAPS
jgi:hypothetical protein